MNGSIQIPPPANEPVLSYAPGTPERAALQAKIEEMASTTVDIPLIIGGKEVRTGDTTPIVVPHDHAHVLGHYHKAGPAEVEMAIEAATEAWESWSRMAWADRSAIFLKVAELVRGKYRTAVNAATMLGQSKTAHQAEIDAACEYIDFMNFNCMFAEEIYETQPISDEGVWNRSEYRPLEGFIYAVSPFNFTSIGGNLAGAPAMMGNVALWKPSHSAVYSNYILMQIFQEAGLPDGVINFIPGNAAQVTDTLIEHPDLAGIHFTGSTTVFQMLWKRVGSAIAGYRSYPRLVGETGGKDFIVAHPSADRAGVRTAIVRGAFEYQGQKCSAASRAYLPRSIYEAIKDDLVADVESIGVGDVADFSNFMGAVIHQDAFDKIQGYIERAKASDDAEILVGGGCDDAKGWFIQPTIILAKNAKYESMCEEIFGPVMTLYVYEDHDFDDVLELVDTTSPYGLTGAIWARDREVIRRASDKLRYAAGNFYVNDKPTGAVVGQQPFGGSRASGTNDKAGSQLNLLRWVTPRSVKETFVAAVDYRYPFMD